MVAPTAGCICFYVVRFVGAFPWLRTVWNVCPYGEICHKYEVDGRRNYKTMSAQWFWEEDLTKKNPVIRIGAEIPFTRYFYKYTQPTPSEELEAKFVALEMSVSERIKRLFANA